MLNSTKRPLFIAEDLLLFTTPSKNKKEKSTYISETSTTGGGKNSSTTYMDLRAETYVCHKSGFVLFTPHPHSIPFSLHLHPQSLLLIFYSSNPSRLATTMRLQAKLTCEVAGDDSTFGYTNDTSNCFMSITTLSMRCCAGSEDVVFTVRKMDKEDERGAGCDVHLCRDDYEEDEGRGWLWELCALV